MNIFADKRFSFLCFLLNCVSAILALFAQDLIWFSVAAALAFICFENYKT